MGVQSNKPCLVSFGALLALGTCVVLYLLFFAGPTCSQLEDVATASGLTDVLQEPYVFFDLDETVVMPDTPFIYGLPGSDGFLDRLTACERQQLPELSRRMEQAYYVATETLVDPDLPQLISDIRDSGRTVLALTSRSRSDDEYAWHNHVVIDSLVEFGVMFSPLPPAVAELGNDTAAGGVLFAGGEGVDKAAFIAKIVPVGTPASLVDNTAEKLRTALANEDVCLHAVHFTAAFHREQSDASRQEWVCRQLEELGTQCSICAMRLG